MGKDDSKEDSGFGFKDKAKAEETLRLLESHEMQYRRLTVRGLLGRAKRVLSLTKAEEKIKNIKEAMAVFEDWIQQLDKDKHNKDKKSENKKSDDKKSEEKNSGDKKSTEKRTEDKKSKDTSKKDSGSDSDVEMEDKEDKKEKSPPPDTVPGLGFKDPEAARRTLQVLEGRDPDYQKLAVKGLLGRAKRVLTCTKDEGKIKSIKEAMDILEKFLTEFEAARRGDDNCAYLPLSVVEGCHRLAVSRGLSLDAHVRFLEAYRGVRGEYKRLRTVAGEGEVTWDVLRNRALAQLKPKHAHAPLFEESGEPSAAHVELALWAYSPDASRLKRAPLPSAPAPSEAEAEAPAPRGDRKRRSSGGGDDAHKRRRE